MKKQLSRIKVVDSAGRIVIPKDMLEVLKIEVNDKLMINCDEENKILTLKKSGNESSINDIKEYVLKPYFETFGNTIIITDKSKVLDVYSKSSNSKLNQIINKKISSEIHDLIFDDFTRDKVFPKLHITDNFEITDRCYYYALKENSYTIGSVIIISNDVLNKDLVRLLLHQLIK